MSRHRNAGLRKVCHCSRKAWPKCRHAWYINYKHGSINHRFSLDKYHGAHIETKDEADKLVRQIKVAIDEGRFSPDGPVTPPAALTVRQLGAHYADKFLAVHRQRIERDERYRLTLIGDTTIDRPNGSRGALGSIPAAEVTAGDIDAFIEARLKGNRRKHCRCTKAAWAACPHTWHTGRAGGRVSVNRCLARLRAVYNWGIRKGYVEASPFKVHGVTAVSLLREEERYRRLEGDEETRLLAACSPHLHALVIAALETACRLGELLSLQWGQVKADLTRLHLPAAKTKAGRDRILPVSNRLMAVLVMRRHDADGKDYGPTDFVFGDETGARVGSIKTAWRAACRRANIHGLHFHDLRREAGSRLLESGHFGLHAVQKFLDHANISTTSRYLKTQQHDLEKAMRAYDAQRAGTPETVATLTASARPPRSTRSFSGRVN